MSALAPRTRRRPSILPRPLYACAGASFLLGGAGVAAWNSAHRVDHGWWLASFLVLVGGIAQVLLGAGQRTVAQPRSLAQAHRAMIRQASLWNAGTLLVPLGVMTDVRLPVVAGSGALMAALARLAVDLRHAPPPGERVERIRASFVSLLLFLAVSVLVGTILAWDLPWV